MVFRKTLFILLFVISLSSLNTAKANELTVHVIIAASDSLGYSGVAEKLDSIISSKTYRLAKKELKFYKSAAKLPKKAQVTLKSLVKLKDVSNLSSYEAFKALSLTTNLTQNVSKLAQTAAKFAESAPPPQSYYAVEYTVKNAASSSLGALAILGLVGDVATLGKELSADKIDTKEAIMAGLSVALDGLQVAAVVTGFTLPGGEFLFTAAPLAVGALLKYTPKFYRYYFNSLVYAENASKISKEAFDEKKTYTFVQCSHKGQTYWGKFLDEGKEASLLDTMTGGVKDNWSHKLANFKLYGSWLSLEDDQQTAFATKNGYLAALRSCKLPLLVKQGAIKTGRKTEIRKLYGTIADDEITFTARDYNYVGRAHPIIFLRDLSKEALTSQ